MKTLIVFSQRRYESCDFGILPKGIRLVAALTKKNYAAVPKKQKTYFSKVYILPEEKDCDELTQYTLSLTDAEKMVKKECELAGSPNEVRLFCGDEGNVSLCGYLRDKYHIPGASYDEILGYRDKLIMKKRLTEKNIRTPYFIAFDKYKASEDIDQYYHEIITKLGTSFILKPVDGSASAVTCKITHLNEFKNIAPKLIESSQAYEAEEFIDGTLYHCDILVQDKVFKLIVTSEYMHPNLDFLEGTILGSFPLSKKDPIKIKIEAFAKRVIRGLGAFDGARHLEVFVNDKKEIIFLEVAARTPGGLAIPCIKKNFDINFLDLAILIEIGEEIEAIKTDFIDYYLWGYLPYIENLSQKSFQPKLKGKLDIEWKHDSNDDLLSSSESIRDFSASFFVREKTYQEAYQDFIKLSKFKFKREKPK